MNDTERQLRDIFDERASWVPAGDDVIATAIQRGRRRIRRRRGLLTMSLVGVLGAGAALAGPIVDGGRGGAQAFAVERHGDEVIARIYRFADAAGLQKQLKEHGVPAKVVYTPKGETCRLPWYTPSTGSKNAIADIKDFGADGYSLTVRLHELAAGDTLVIRNANHALSGPSGSELPGAQLEGEEGRGSVDSAGTVHTEFAHGIGVAVARGDVPDCQLVDTH